MYILIVVRLRQIDQFVGPVTSNIQKAKVVNLLALTNLICLFKAIHKRLNKGLLTSNFDIINMNCNRTYQFTILHFVIHF